MPAVDLAGVAADGDRAGVCPLNLEKAAQISTEGYFPGDYTGQSAVGNTLLTLTTATTQIPGNQQNEYFQQVGTGTEQAAIPVAGPAGRRGRDHCPYRVRGIEAVIDKGLAAALLARQTGADALLLTDVDGVEDEFGTPHARPIRRATVGELRARTFPAGSMGPKVEAACRFAEATGGIAAIGRLRDAGALLDGQAGTMNRTFSAVPSSTGKPRRELAASQLPVRWRRAKAAAVVAARSVGHDGLLSITGIDAGYA